MQWNALGWPACGTRSSMNNRRGGGGSSWGEVIDFRSCSEFIIIPSFMAIYFPSSFFTILELISKTYIFVRRTNELKSALVFIHSHLPLFTSYLYHFQSQAEWINNSLLFPIRTYIFISLGSPIPSFPIISTTISVCFLISRLMSIGNKTMLSIDTKATKSDL